VSRTSVEAYRDTDRPIREIGRELRADYLLEGGVQRAGDRVRITVQLIDAREDVHLWADTYDRVLAPESLFDVQSDVVRNVARELDVTLREEDLQRAARRTTRDPEAYDLFTRGREAWERGAIREATELFDRAIEHDPDFVVAHAAAAEAHAWVYSQSGRTPERAEAARRAAQRAVELDPESEDAQLAMGWYLYRVEKDYPEALGWLARASGNLRGDDRYHAGRGYMGRRAGRWRAAVASLETAATLSPGSPIYPRELAATLLRMRRYSEAEDWLRECLARPGLGLCLNNLGHLDWMRDGTPDAWHDLQGAYSQWELHMVLGDYRGALAALEGLGETHISQWQWYPKELLQALAHEGLGQVRRAEEGYAFAASILERQVEGNSSDERYHQALGLAYAGLRRRDDAVREAATAAELLPVERDALGGPEYLFVLAAVHARVGETEEALAILERVLTIPSRFSAAKLRTHYLLTPLHDDPAFLALLEREPGRVF
jgi:serine/threonine-protein kinase